MGIGKEDPKFNPFFKYEFKLFTKYFSSVPSINNSTIKTGDAILFPTDACLGIEGLPQSGTGQTSIFCGINAPKKIGKHFGPYPYSTLIPFIEKKNIFQEFINKGKKVAFANAYPSVFFEYINSGRRRLSVTSLSCILSGVRLRNETDLRKGNAVSAEIDNKYWVKKLNYKIPVIKPQTAAKHLLNLASKNHFTLFEHFVTDHLGHGRNKGDLEERLRVLDEFLLYIFRNRKNNMHVFLCSDHGNIEDLSVKTHTYNKAITIVAGKNAGEISKRIKNISQIKKAILGIF